MKVLIRNLSKKPRSRKAMNELRQFTTYMVSELSLSEHVDIVKLTYRDRFTGYYPKGKPLGGFFKLYKNKIVNIDIADFWDRNKECRHVAIIHELTHVQQMAHAELEIAEDCKSLKWRGKICNSWKSFNESIYSAIICETQAKRYMYKRMPWERSVGKNVDKYSFRKWKRWDK